MAVKVKQINQERLAGWEKRLNEAHCTPVMLIGFGHDHNEGIVTILVTEDRTDSEIMMMLKGILQRMEL